MACCYALEAHSDHESSDCKLLHPVSSFTEDALGQPLCPTVRGHISPAVNLLRPPKAVNYSQGFTEIPT
jgi:hypothetical protein